MVSETTKEIRALMGEFGKKARFVQRVKEKIIYGNPGGGSKRKKTTSKKSSKGVVEPRRETGNNGTGDKEAPGTQAISARSG